MKQLFKTKQPQKKEAATAVSPLADLKSQLEQACASAEAYIETIVAKEKREHTLLSVEWIRQDLHLKHGRCLCKCALALMPKETGNG